MRPIKCRIKHSFPGSISGIVLAAPIVATLLVGGTPIDAAHAFYRQISEESAAKSVGMKHGDVERGRSVFNGKGICQFCHGRDGDLRQLPQLSPETTSIIAGLSPKPSDLRDGRSLKLKTDQERFKAIRGGHSGTAMLPDTQLQDEEIIDVLAYLSTLRGE